MRFRHRLKNRRLKRSQVLDVKLRSGHLRASRLRRLRLFLQTVLLLAIGTFLLWQVGEWGLNHFIYENDLFAVQTIEVQTDGSISPEQLKRWANVHPQDNLVRLDLARIKRDLELCPSIRSATVERWLPATVRIRVQERRPAAQVHAFHHRSDGGGFEQMTFELDETGMVMVPLEDAFVRPAALSDLDALPILTGLPEALLRVGKKADAPSVEAALKLIQTFQSSSMADEVQIRQLDLGRPQVIRLITAEGSEVIFAFDQLERQLDRWRVIHDFAARQGKTILSLDLSVSNHIPALWMESSPAHPPPARPPKTEPPPKKYV